MWSIGDDEPATSAPTRPDCPGCGEPDLHGDDFCHECGHAFAHFGAGHDDLAADERGAPCPMCASGELAQLEYGRTQCDSCGYTLRDEG
jgi:ribosomal protein L37AE/L43A